MCILLVERADLQAFRRSFRRSLSTRRPHIHPQTSDLRTVDPTYEVSEFNGSSCDTGDKAIEKQIVSDSQRHRGDQGTAMISPQKNTSPRIKSVETPNVIGFWSDDETKVSA